MAPLPWPWDGKRGNSIVAEWQPYHDWLKGRPELDDDSRRPRQAVADNAWRLLEQPMSLEIQRFVGRPGTGQALTPAERSRLEPEARRALVVALDTALASAESGRMLTKNALFDALALRWSVNYRAVIGRPARSAYEMRAETIGAIWRELQLAGIRFDALWDAILGPKEGRRHFGVPGIYRVASVVGRGHVIRLQEPSTTVREDLDAALGPLTAPWRVSRKRKRLRLSGAASTTASVDEAPQEDDFFSAALENLTEWLNAGDYNMRVAAEREYCQVVNGARGRQVLEQMAAAELHVSADDLRSDLADVQSNLTRIGQRLSQAGVDIGEANMRPRTTTDRLVNATTGGLIRYLQPGETVMSGKRVIRKARKRAADKSVYQLREGERVSKTRPPKDWDRQIAQLAISKPDKDSLHDAAKRYDATAAQVSALKGIVSELPANATGHLVIRSRFQRTVNRRFQAMDFWPAEVMGKDFAPVDPAVRLMMPQFLRSAMFEQASRRARWFKVSSPDPDDEKLYDLAGYDISSSQIQILAVFLGLDDLEAIATDPTRSFKATVADRAIALHDEPGPFALPDKWIAVSDRSGLEDMLKTAVMTSLYGSEPNRVVRTLWEEHKPGLGNPHEPSPGAEERLRMLLWDEQLHLEGVWKFLHAGQHIATKVCSENPYAGVTFTDPLDGERVRWNPFRIQPKQVTRGPIYAVVPVGEPDTGEHAGDYPVDRRALGGMIAPCLTHMLDAMFAAIVLQHVKSLSTEVYDPRNIVSIHDAWLVADHHASKWILGEAIRQAGRTWLLKLGPVYEDLISYLGGTDYEDWAFIIRARWQARVTAKTWPEFRAAPAKMVIQPTGLAYTATFEDLKETFPTPA